MRLGRELVERFGERKLGIYMIKTHCMTDGILRKKEKCKKNDYNGTDILFLMLKGNS